MAMVGFIMGFRVSLDGKVGLNMAFFLGQLRIGLQSKLSIIQSNIHKSIGIITISIQESKFFNEEKVYFISPI